MELVGGGSVLNGAYPVYFVLHQCAQCPHCARYTYCIIVHCVLTVPQRSTASLCTIMVQYLIT